MGTLSVLYPSVVLAVHDSLAGSIGYKVNLIKCDMLYTNFLIQSHYTSII